MAGKGGGERPTRGRGSRGAAAEGKGNISAEEQRLELLEANKARGQAEADLAEANRAKEKAEADLKAAQQKLDDEVKLRQKCEEAKKHEAELFDQEKQRLDDELATAKADFQRAEEAKTQAQNALSDAEEGLREAEEAKRVAEQELDQLRNAGPIGANPQDLQDALDDKQAAEERQRQAEERQRDTERAMHDAEAAQFEAETAKFQAERERDEAQRELNKFQTQNGIDGLKLEKENAVKAAQSNRTNFRLAGIASLLLLAAVVVLVVWLIQTGSQVALLKGQVSTWEKYKQATEQTTKRLEDKLTKDGTLARTTVSGKDENESTIEVVNKFMQAKSRPGRIGCSTFNVYTTCANGIDYVVVKHQGGTILLKEPTPVDPEAIDRVISIAIDLYGSTW